MDKQDMIDRNQSLIHKLVGKCQILITGSIIPKFIGTMLTVKKLADIFGYKSAIGFVKACLADDPVLEERFDALDEKTKAEVEDLYENVFCPQVDEVISECDEGQKMMEQADIAENVIEALSGDTDEPSSDDDDDDDSLFDKVTGFIIDKLFDGVDITRGLGDDEPDDDGDEWS